MAFASIALAITRTALTRLTRVLALSLVALGTAQPGLAQDQAGGSATREDTRTQYPVLLANSYISLNVGYVDYPFSTKQLEPGFAAQSISIPRVAVRAVLIGHQ